MRSASLRAGARRIAPLLLAAGAVGAMAAWSVAVPQRPAGGLEVFTVRFYRGGQTLVDGFCRVPYGLLEPVGGGMGRGVMRAAAYRVSLAVRDSAGLVLLTSTWTDTVPEAVARMAGASSVEHFTFAAPAGRYAVEVAVTDSASGRTVRERTEVVTFSGAPHASDLLLSSAMRRGADSVLRPGEIRKGGVFIVSTTRPVLTPREARLYYYVELYPRGEGQVETLARVVAADGRQIIAAEPLRTEVGAAGGVATSGLDLTGLPPGDYQLALDVRFGDTTITPTASFAMAGFETEAAAAHAGAAVLGDMVSHLTEAQLDTLYGPLVHIMEAGERGIYDGLSLEGKRNYLRSFWAKRDPSPKTADNEAQAEFYIRIAEANRRYREGGSAEVPGWRTDRGRIFIRYGEPDEVLRRPQSGPTPPYEVWKYTSVRPRKFVFFDPTRFGNYQLIYTDERREPSRGDWEQLLGAEAVLDIQRFD